MVRIKILLVDDEVIIKRVIIEKIEWEKYDMEIVKAANSAQEALDYLDEYYVDLVITDMKMPLMDGNDFIEKAKQINKNLKFLVLSAYTDFEIVRKSFKLGVFDYMQKSDINTPTMYNLLTKIRNEINKEKRAASNSQLSTSGTEIGYNNRNEIIVPVISKTKEYSILYVRFSFSKNIFRDIYQIIKKDKTCSEKLFLLEINDDNITLLIEHDFTSYDRKKNGAAYIVKQIRKQLDIKKLSDFCIGISDIGFGSNIESLKYEAQKATENEYYSDGSKKTFFYNRNSYDIDKDDNRLTVEYWKSKLDIHTKTLDIANANKVFEELAVFIQTIGLAKNKCQELCFNIYLYYVNFLYSNNIISNNIEQDYAKVYNIIKQLETFEQLNKWIKNNLISIQKAYTEKYKSNITQILKIYIKQNLNRDLSLSNIAEQYGFNHSYISHLFKEKEGIPLRRYINNIRIDKAKYYLANTNIKVKDICGLIGYSSPEHFSREFKKKQGQSPNCFRNQRSV